MEILTYGYYILIYIWIAMSQKSTKMQLTKMTVSTAFCESSFTSVEKWKILNILVDEFD